MFGPCPLPAPIYYIALNILCGNQSFVPISWRLSVPSSKTISSGRKVFNRIYARDADLDWPSRTKSNFGRSVRRLCLSCVCPNPFALHIYSVSCVCHFFPAPAAVKYLDSFARHHCCWCIVFLESHGPCFTACLFCWLPYSNLRWLGDFSLHTVKYSDGFLPAPRRQRREAIAIKYLTLRRHMMYKIRYFGYILL